MSDLLRGEVQVGSYVMTSRGWAADLLYELSENVHVGMYPPELSAFDLGRALGRALANCNENDPVKELDRGLDHYYSNKEKWLDD